LVAVSTGVADRSVLLVEDDHALVASLRYSLEQEGFRVSVSVDGVEAIETIRRDRPLLVLLDLVLPGMTGFDVCRLIRNESNVPILILTCRGSEADRVTGLELGADGYMTKPFSVTELVWRLRAMIRRAAISGAPAEPMVLRFGPVEMDLSRHEATVRGARVRLRPREFDLLRAFMERPQRLLTREFLIAELWGGEPLGDLRTLDVHVMRLRRLIEVDPRSPEHLVPVRGIGYRFTEPAASRTAQAVS
jgi:DNA-binding response OmpR family regulator